MQFNFTDATILLEIDLTKVVNCGEAFENDPEMEYENFKSFPVAFKIAKSWHLRGNNYFQGKNYKCAIGWLV